MFVQIGILRLFWAFVDSFSIYVTHNLIVQFSAAPRISSLVCCVTAHLGTSGLVRSVSTCKSCSNVSVRRPTVVSVFYASAFDSDWRLENLDIVLPLDDKSWNPIVRLTIRITKQSMATVTDTTKEAWTAAQKLSPSLVANVADGVPISTDTVSNQSIVTSFGSLLRKVGILVKVGNKVAKVCPLLSSTSSHCPKIVEDPPLCQLCLEGAFHGTELWR